MDEDCCEEVSDQEEEVAVVSPFPVVAVAPLNVEVPEIPDNPECPSPEPSTAPSGGPSPDAWPPGSPAGGVTSVMVFLPMMILPGWNNGLLNLGPPGRIRLVGSKGPMFHQI